LSDPCTHKQGEERESHTVILREIETERQRDREMASWLKMTAEYNYKHKILAIKNKLKFHARISTNRI
jgi:hypothetical protein